MVVLLLALISLSSSPSSVSLVDVPGEVRIRHKLWTLRAKCTSEECHYTPNGYRVNRDWNVPGGVAQTEGWESEVAGGSDCGLVTVPER